LDALRSRFRASLHHLVTACVNRSSVRGSSSSTR
jgi:hypothetical protein